MAKREQRSATVTAYTEVSEEMFGVPRFTFELAMKYNNKKPDDVINEKSVMVYVDKYLNQKERE